MPKNNSSGPSIQTVQRIADILRCLSENDAELGVTAISNKLGLHKSTAFRLLSSLEYEGFVEQNPDTSKYKLGLGLVSLAGVVLERIDFRQAAQTYLRQLAKLTQETINLTILSEDNCINIDYFPSPKPIIHAGQLGRRTPLHCTSTGKIFLAHMTPNERHAHLPETLPKFTENTIVDFPTLDDELLKVRDRGYATACEEFQDGLCAIAAPLRNHSGEIIAAISISGPAYRLEGDNLGKFIDAVQRTADAISAQLGYAPMSDKRTANV